MENLAAGKNDVHLFIKNSNLMSRVMSLYIVLRILYYVLLYYMKKRENMIRRKRYEILLVVNSR